MNFLINIATSGKHTEKSEFGLTDYHLRYVLMNFSSIAGISALVMFTVLNLQKGWYFSSFVCIGMILIDLLCLILARTKISQIVPFSITAISFILLCVMVTRTGEASGANFLFIYIYPPLAVILLGTFYGVILSVILVVLISLEMFIPGLADFNYPFDFSIRMLVNYIILLAVIIMIEFTRKIKDRIIQTQRETLEKQVDELKYFNNRLQKTTEELFSANEKLRALSTTDELTKLNNRRSFLDYIDVIWKQCRRLHVPVSLLMIDIDYFKKYNDTLGHLEGDKALIAIAQCMQNQLKRETDFVARFGGEEFVCLLPYIEKSDALFFANELVKSVEDMQIPHPTSELSNYVTISAGLARILPGDHNTYTQLLHEADKALYTAKQSGRNRVVAV